MNAEFNFTLADLSRVNVVGASSSGKSTFSKRLAAAIEVPFIEMDLLFHEPNWNEPTADVFRDRIRHAISGPRWVLDGNYHSKTSKVKWARATMIVWLDVSFIVNMHRATKRAIRRSWTGEELWPGTGNRETFRRNFFSSESMILWTAMSHRRLRKRYRAVYANPPEGVKLVRLKSNAQVDRFLVHAKQAT